MKKFTTLMTAAALGLAGLMPLQAAPGYAMGKGYCDNYARKVANKKTHHGGDIVLGTAVGIGAGALLGTIIGGKHAIGKGMIIGGVGGAAVSGISTNERWHKIYKNAYAECRAS